VLVLASQLVWAGTVPVTGCNMGATATNTLKTRLLGVKLKHGVRVMGVILFPSILLRKIALFINSVSVRAKTSGLDLMTKMQTGPGSGRTPLPGPMPTGHVWSTLETGGSRTVGTCLPVMEQHQGGDNSVQQNGT